MTIKFNFRMSGSAADGQTWTIDGTVEVAGPGDFREALEKAQADSFMQLTGGLAEYGKPGVGCRGPYRITRLFIMEAT